MFRNFASQLFNTISHYLTIKLYKLTMKNYIKSKENTQNNFLIILPPLIRICFEEFCICGNCMMEMLHDGVLRGPPPVSTATSVMFEIRAAGAFTPQKLAAAAGRDSSPSSHAQDARSWRLTSTPRRLGKTLLSGEGNRRSRPCLCSAAGIPTWNAHVMSGAGAAVSQTASTVEITEIPT